MSLSSIIFYILSSGAIISSIMVITARNPIHSVLFLVLVFFNVAGLLILVDIEFLAIMFLIIYVGAIAVLFLFIIMMLNIKVRGNYSLSFVTIVYFFAFVCCLEMYLNFYDSFSISIYISNINMLLFHNWSCFFDKIANISLIGNLVYTQYVVLFILAGFILFIAILSTIMLTLKTNESLKQQNLSKQLVRQPNNAVMASK